MKYKKSYVILLRNEIHEFMERLAQIKKLSEKDKVWDIVVVGGGATGLGVAVDAATRGLSVALLEKTDFAKCTSSRSTKLVHGGVRYLQKGDVMLVLEALRETRPHESQRPAPGQRPGIRDLELQLLG